MIERAANRRATSSRRTRAGALALAVVLGATSACGDRPTGPPGGDIGWESVTIRATSASVLVEDVTYRSGSLVIEGRVCRPNRGGANPALIWNHGGFVGFAATDDDVCDSFARLGYAVLMSSYRGQDASGGQVEACLGEVDDVLALTDIARQQPYVNSQRMVMAGASHGGCVTLRAVQRGAQVHAAVAIAPPTNWVALYHQYADSALLGDPARRATYEALIADMEQALGGTPGQQVSGYAARSPTNFSSATNAWNRPLLLIHGTADDYVFAMQSCLMATAIGGVTAMHVQSDGGVSDQGPQACQAAFIEWNAGPRPGPQWPNDRYLLVYQGVGHTLDGASGARAVNDAVSFLLAKTP